MDRTNKPIKIHGGDEFELNADGEFFVNGEHIPNDDLAESSMPGEYVFDMVIPKSIDEAYTNLVQDSTDLSISKWENTQELPLSLEDITRELISPYMESIETLKTEMVIPLGKETIKVVYSAFGKLNDADKSIPLMGHYILRNEKLGNLTLWDIKHLSPGSTLVEKLKVGDLQLVSNPVGGFNK